MELNNKSLDRSHSRTSRLHLSSTFLCLLATLSLAGCGGGDSSDPASSNGAASSASSSSQSSSVSSSSSSSASTVPPLSVNIVSIEDGHQVGAAHWPDGDTANGGLGQPISGIQCNATSQVYHVHSHLSIYLNGQALAVPALIGIVETSPTAHCNYLIHTHDRSGLIHVEAPAPATFTLGQFFAIWGEPLGLTDVAGNSGMPVTVYITDNNVTSEYGGDLATIELTAHREITIQIGTPIAEIPSYTWID